MSVLLWLHYFVFAVLKLIFGRSRYVNLVIKLFQSWYRSHMVVSGKSTNNIIKFKDNIFFLNINSFCPYRSRTMLLLIQTEFFLAYILQYISDMLVYLFDKGQDVTIVFIYPKQKCVWGIYPVWLSVKQWQ